MKILITGCAGFIGFNLCTHLLAAYKKIKIVGIDNLNNYYSVDYKKKRINELKYNKNFVFKKADINNLQKIKKIFDNNKFDLVINLAAQAGVRYSIKNPHKYISSNILGFANIIEICRIKKIKKIFYASSSSVYGDSKNFPLKENQNLMPKNIYALSKKINEDLAETYSRLYKMHFIGLRFFTVYGEWGRPDMFIMKYIISSLKNKNFKLNNFGNHYRDFTYIKDVVKILEKLILKDVKSTHEIFNICSSRPIKITEVLSLIHNYFKPAKIIKVSLQRADALKTHGSNVKICKFLDLKNFTSIQTGIEKTSLWIKNNFSKF
jgi:UDP-glucuronate 4-epimerase